MAKICPLVAYFETADESQKDFIERVGIPHSTMQDILRGVTKDPAAATLAKIERGTGGAVTIHAMLEWLEEVHGEAPKA